MADKYISQITPLGSSTTYLLKDKKAIESIARDGTTFTATRRDGTTFTFTQQDNNTIYTFASGTDGSFSVTPSDGSAQTISIGKPATAGTADVANSVAWGNITGKPSSFTPSSHTHYELATQGDNRNVATTPNDYVNRLIFRGLKSNSYFDSPSSDTYSYIVGLRGWCDSSGGHAHELAFNNTGIYWRSGATTSWGSWYRIYTTGNKPTKSDIGLGNVTNDAQIPKSIGTTKGDIIYWSAASTPIRLGIGSAGQVLKVSSDGIPAWSNDNNSITGVKGDAESSYRTGNVNLTPANILNTGTTAQFWRGDNGWSNTIKQTANAALGIDTNLKIGTARKDLNFDIANGSGTGINNGYAGGITWGSGTSAYAGIYYQTSSSYGSRLHFATTSSYANGAYTRMLITHDGKIGIGTLTPSTALHVIGDITASGLTASQAVSTDANKKLVSSNLTTESPSTSGSGIEYIATVSQNAVGKITATKSTVRDASASQSGVVSTGAQTFAGNKTFNGIIDINNTTRINREEHPSDAFSTSVGITPLNIFGLKNGYPVYTDPDFSTGVNSVGVYNNTSGGNVVHTRQLYSAANVPHPGTSSGYVITIQTKGVASPGVGGFVQSISSRENAVFVQIFRALVPEGRKVNIASNSMGTSYTDKWLTSQEGTGKWEWYARIVHCGATGTFSNGGHIYLDGAAGTASAPVTWHLAFCNLYDITKGQYDGLRVREADNADTATKAAALSPAGTTAQFWRGDNTWSNELSGGQLKITNYSNTVTIGSGNANYTHFNNSADIPFYFNKSIWVDGDLYPYGTSNTRSLGSSSKRWKSLLIGTADSYGGTTKPIYWKNGVPTELSETVGATDKPVFLSSGTITESTSTIGSGIIPIYMDSGQIKASVSTVGNGEWPVYLNSGTIAKTTYYLKSNIEDGSANHLAYYSAARTIDYTPNITRGATSITIAGSSSAAAQYIVSNGTNQISLHQAAGGNRGIYQNAGDVTGDWLLYWPNGSKEAHIVQSNLIIDSGNLYAGVTSSATERQVHARAAAGDIYLYSQGSASGTRGLYTPAHGDDTSGRYVIQVTANNNAGFADYYNHTITKLAYSQASLADTAFTYPTVWNGYELRATTKSALRDAIEKQGIHEDYLLWGGHDIGTNSWSPIDVVLNDYTRGNGFAMLPAANITVQHSTNSGSTWTTTSITDLVKRNLVTNNQSGVRIVASGNVSNNATPQLRITIKCSGATYFQLKKIHLLISTNYSTGCTVTILGSLNSAPTTFDQTICSNVGISGWSGWNSITCDHVVGAGTSQIHSLQFTFKQTGINPNYTNSGLIIYNISGYGYMKHTSPSTLALWSHAYTIDGDTNITLPSTSSLIISKSVDASGTADNKPALIVGGLSTASHIEIDSNEILAKSNGTTPTTLYLQDTTGTVSVAGSGGLIVSSLTASQAVSTDANKKLVSSNLTTASPSASGSGIEYIATVSQNAVGKITATKSTVRNASTSQTGVLQFTTANTNTQLNTLTTGSSTPVDADYYISQYVGGGTTTTTYHRRPMSALWDYIKGHIIDDLYWANIKVQDSSKTDTIPTFKTIYFGMVDPTTNGRGILAFSSTYPNYGLWYFNDSIDVITLDGHGKANSKTEADLAINALGAGIISTRNRYIPHTGNTTGTVGTATRPVYVNAGAITQGSYELKATVNTGTANRAAYYSGTNTIEDAGSIYMTASRLGVNATTYQHTLGGASSTSDFTFSVLGNGFIRDTIYTNTELRVYRTATGNAWRVCDDTVAVGSFSINVQGTTSQSGLSYITIGNTLPATTKGNAKGRLYLGKQGAAWHVILGENNNAKSSWHYLPDATGWVVTAGDGTSTGAGSANVPVYVDANGVVQACTAYGSATVATANAIKTTLMTNASTAIYVLGTTGTAADTSATVYKGYRTSTAKVYFRGDTGVLMGAAWNDYAEYRQAKNDIEIEPGRVVKEVGDETLELTTERLQRGCSIVSNTFGISIGESNINKLPLAVSGRVLAYPYEDREEFKNHIGWPVCSGPNGTVSIMTEEEEMKYPSRIIGTISAVPDYEIWHGGADVIVDGRVWIKVK